MNTEITLRQFVRSYWNYFLELEEQLISTKRFVDFDKANNKTFSIEYLKLLQASCSEIDVVAKIMAESINPEFRKFENKNIQKWGYEILTEFPMLTSVEVCFNNDYTLIPWANWGYEKYNDTKGRTRYKLLKGCETPSWWTAYNKVKHERTSVYDSGQTNYVRANLDNLVAAMSALFILENVFLESLTKNDTTLIAEQSRLFKVEKS